MHARTKFRLAKAEALAKSEIAPDHSGTFVSCSMYVTYRANYFYVTLYNFICH